MLLAKGLWLIFYFSGAHYLLLFIIICYVGGDECCLPTSKGSMVFFNLFFYSCCPGGDECCLPTSKGSIVWSMALGGAGILVYVLGVFVCGRVGAAEQAAAVQRSSGVSDLATRWTSWMTGML